MSSSGRSPKGTACINCRQRKIRCDGNRPVCGSCSTTLPSACRYSDGGPSLDQVLQEEIAILETRIQQLENPSDTSQSMALHNPYAPSGQSSSRSQHVPFQISPNMMKTLFRSFMPYSSEFGFFLDFQRFSSSMASGTHRPATSIISVCNLFGSYLSPVNEISTLQPSFLTQALYDVAHGLQGNHPQRALHCIQAEVLLAQYLFINGRIMEGKYRISTAVSIVLAAGFHKIRGLDAFAGQSGTGSVPPPVDVVDEGERINALWTVLILNHCWTAADGSPSNIVYDVPASRIDTPWPLDAGAYAQTPLPDNVRGSHTIQNFLANVPDNGRSLLALHAKAAILFEQASLMFRKYRPNMGLQEATHFQKSFTSLNNLIKRMASELPPLGDSHNSRSITRRLLVIHTLCRVSTIQLHYTFADTDPASHGQIISAADSVVGLLRITNLTEFPFIDPIIGTLWIATAKVFTDEITSMRSNASSNIPRRMSPNDLVNAVEVILAAMSVFAPRSSLMDAQLRQVRQDFTAAMH